MSNTENEWYYDYILETISSPQFRNPIKDFIDENCIVFVGEEENSVEQGILFKKFTKLVESLLEISLTELGITEEMFCLAAKKGLENPIAKKYFEQLISFTNYNYFKSLMTRRNMQLEDMQNMNSKNVKQKKKKVYINDRELQEAIKMSKATEEEIRKLKALEERELIRALKLSQMYSNPNPVVESYQKKTVPSIVNKQIQQSIPIKSNESNPNKTNVNTLPNKPIQKPEIKIQEIEKKEIKNQEISKPIIPEIKTPTPIQPKSLIDDDKEDEEKDEKPLIDEDTEQPVNPIDKVIQKKKKEIPESNIQYEIGKKNVILPPNTNSGRGTLSNTLNKNLNDLETEKVRKLREYREMILNIEREKRKKKEEFENTNNMNDEEKRRLALRMQLAEKLKRHNLEKKNEDE